MRLLSTQDHQRNALEGKTIAVIGYGSQGRAHAQNLRDSGYRVIIGAREGGTSAIRARDHGFAVYDPATAAENADLVALLTPDMAQPAVYRAIEGSLKAGGALLFAHGFNVHYGSITPRADIDVIMIAPKAPGDLVRRQFEEGRGVPCLRAIYQDASGEAGERALSYAHGLGGTRAGVLDTTFEEETETDLFGEQAVLCGGTAELIIKGFETLCEAGYQPEVAYFECLHELKLIVDLMYEGGLSYMWYSVSNTAEQGGYEIGDKIEGLIKEEFDGVLHRIQNGDFADRWIEENKQGRPNFNARRKQEHDLLIEEVGENLRDMMPFLDAKKIKQQD